MVKLDEHGYTAVVVIVLYIPVVLASIVLVMRYGFSRQAGWVMLLLLGIVRIVGGVTELLSSQNPSIKTLQIIFIALESAGLSPLLNAAIGLLGTVTQHTLEDHFLAGKAPHILTIVCTVAIVLTAYGASQMGNAKTAKDLSNGSTLRHVGSGLIGFAFVALAIITFFCWSHRGRILKYRRKLLAAVLASLPFLCVRVVYSILGAFAAPTIGFDEDGQKVIEHPNDPLEKFVPFTGSFLYYVVFSLAMEYIVVALFTVVGITTPLKKDEYSIIDETTSRPKFYEERPLMLSGKGHIRDSSTASAYELPPEV